MLGYFIFFYTKSQWATNAEIDFLAKLKISKAMLFTEFLFFLINYSNATFLLLLP